MLTVGISCPAVVCRTYTLYVCMCTAIHAWGLLYAIAWAFCSCPSRQLGQCEGLEGGMGSRRIPRLNQYVFCKYL